MSALRPRGIFRAAAMLAVGVSPLLAGSASATEAPQVDSVTPKVGAPTELSVANLPAAEVIGGEAVKLPAAPVAVQAVPQERDLDQVSSVLSQAVPEVQQATPVLGGLSALTPMTGPAGQLPGVGDLAGLTGVTQQLPIGQLPTGQLPTGQLAAEQLKVLPEVGDAAGAVQLPVPVPPLG